MTVSARLRELADRATPGPWYAIGYEVTKPEVDIVRWAYHDMPPAEWPEHVAHAEDDARLIALAPELAVWAADADEQLRLENEKHPNHNITKLRERLAALLGESEQTMGADE